ncbi:hypothetical protein SASPL_104950 [Salvia splendens]|uniref:hAT-like transposase RNase-H fold domain-containing protein n=1 Tax=Salvia splendens TaxID=180675 RepID=A0A8X8YNQ1_SALSN|nr:hypothetical protein SASPL_104950 [Salvia splendens]
MSNSESFTQDIGSNRPLNDILEDIEVEELGLDGEEEEEGMAPPASKKRKHVVRSTQWHIRYVEASCFMFEENEAEKNQTPLSQDELRQDIQERGRYALCRMIVLDEQPFRFVEREGFHDMKQMGMAVVRVREAVKWINGSSARSKAFKDIAKATLPYEPAMKLFNNVNPQFDRDLRNLKHNDLTVGVPGEEDWIEVRKVCSFLQSFYVMTRLVSGTTYAYSHSFLMEMCDIFHIIKWSEEDDEDAEYWLEEYERNPNMNKILYIAAMLDPRQKMKHVEFCLKKMYGDARANELAKELRKSIFDLFELYKKEFTPVADQTRPRTASTSQISASTSQISNRPTVRRFLGKSSCNILCVASEDDDKDDSSELTRYFPEKQYKASEHEHFDILIWWKTYVGIQHGGHVLLTFRYSLAPEMVEALICSEDWLRSCSSSADLMEEGENTILRKQYYESE